MLPVMLQRWHEISFFHWNCEPQRIQQHLPNGLTVDTYNSDAWIGLTPFLLVGLRPPPLPKRFGLSFPEMNLRTYVRGPAGPGIWFFSLDAAKYVAVLGARITYGLPYYLARMRVDLGEHENFYTSKRGNDAAATIRILKGPRIRRPSRLERFLTERYRLYSAWEGRLVTAQVRHRTWTLQKAGVLEFDESVRKAAGIQFPSSEFLVHHSTGINARIGRPTFVVRHAGATPVSRR